MHLSFDIGDISSRLSTRMISLPVGHDAVSAVLALSIGDEVLLYGEKDGVDAVYCATARFCGLEKRTDGSISAVKLNKFDWFGQHVPRYDLANSYWESLAEEACKDIVDKGRSRVFSGLDAPDAQAEFAHPIPIENYTAVSKQVSANFRFRCALTGYFNSNEPLEATPIRPVPDGGRLHVGNFLFLTGSAAYAFSRFQLSVGPSLEIIVDNSLIKSDLSAALNPRGFLTDAPDSLRFVDMDSLAWHRHQFFARIG
jgi:predicted restriction endonuclease